MAHDNSNLPSGITQDHPAFDLQDIPLKDCPECEDNKDLPPVSACCGAILDQDFNICSECCQVSEPAKCKKCGGEGKIPMTIEEIHEAHE